MSAPDKKIPVGILGATGMVGQQYVTLLANHPWFEITAVAASFRSSGIPYSKAIENRWCLDTPPPATLKDLVVQDATHITEIASRCKIVFSAIELEKEELKKLEENYAHAGMHVVSNASAHRWTHDVPMIIPEINASHLQIIPEQQKNRGWKGSITVKPNCSIQSYLAPLYALIRAGYPISKIFVTTLQALSGAGYPGVASLDMIDNVIPYINGEEEKTEKEPLKILGTIQDGKFVLHTGLEISAHCNRVAVRDGHLACVSIGFQEKIPSIEETINIWQQFRSVPQELNLPSAPFMPIIYSKEENRPQPRKDRMYERGMGITVGRVRACTLLDLKFVGLSHNTLRGAAGGGVLNAELMIAKHYAI
ncbi:aspartate-semialdehyde dehydrogenase [Candidatus Uhrbacteria bacterium]|nr:aspartate-semialdehyde dehydrogenase [Candidatus Uhrbacteria bacterium]